MNSTVFGVGAYILALPLLGAGELRFRGAPERMPSPLEALPEGVHACPPETAAFARARTRHLDHLCIRSEPEWKERNFYGSRHGPVERFDARGRRLLEGSYANGGRSGEWTIYRDDGSVFHVLRFERGAQPDLGSCPEGSSWARNHGYTAFWCHSHRERNKHGPALFLHAWKLRWSVAGGYAHGERHGTWVTWNEAGRVERVEQFEHGARVWSYHLE